MIPLRRLSEVRASGDGIWFEHALDRLSALPREADPRLRAFFSADSPIYIARAPGRLDVMGGIADYSGACVLELPLACSTAALVQLQEIGRCDTATLQGEGWHCFGIDLPLGTPQELAARFAGKGGASDRWASYILGVVQRFLTRAAGLRVLIDSTVPEGRGVASSAALEVAVATAVAAACGSAITPADLAAACQEVENNVVGAPCGIMDQMTSACGRRDRLLLLRCQPGTSDQDLGHVDIPAGYRFYGIDSGISHAVAGADYGTVRTAAFMGYRMIAAAAGLPAMRDGVRVRVDDGRWGGYLANLTGSELAALGALLPEEMSGAEFLARYDGTTDTATQVLAGRRYPVRQATEHPIREHARVLRFAELLGALAREPGAALELGRLMYESHGSYGACGLGSDGTDRLVELVAALGPERGLFGAKITGGGSGGTVAVLATSAAEPLVRDVAARYRAETGRDTTVFTASGPGAAETGVLLIEP